MESTRLLKPTSKHSPLITRLTERFLAMKHADEISYDEISTLVGLDVRSQLGRSVLQRARTRAVEGGVVLENLREMGYRRSTPGDVCRDGLKEYIPSVRRANKRAAQKIATVNPFDSGVSLSSEERRANMAARALTGMVEQAVSPRAVAKTLHQIEAVKSPDPSAMLEQLKKNT